MKVELTRRARADLIAIGDYLERVAGRRTALRWVTRLEERALRLGRQPFAGPEDPDFGGRRRVVVRPYVIAYRIILAKRILVVRIVHGARDLPSLFSVEDDA